MPRPRLGFMHSTRVYVLHLFHMFKSLNSSNTQKQMKIMYRSRLHNVLRSQSLAPLHPCRSIVTPPVRAAFSTSRRRDIMGMTGFTEEQLTVREAISHICSKFPNTYWQERDQQEKDPKEFHAALAKDGWLGIALPESLGGAGLGNTMVNRIKKYTIC